MDSFQSLTADPRQTAYLWDQLVNLLGKVLDSNPEFLETEADNLSLPHPAELISHFRRRPPTEALPAYHAQNPDVDLGNLTHFSQEQKEQAAAGLLAMLAVELDDKGACSLER